MVQLSNAVSVAGHEESTEAVASSLANVIGDDIGRFDEAFELAVGEGRGAGLAGEVAQQLHQAGRVDYRGACGDLALGGQGARPRAAPAAHQPPAG